MQNRCIRCKGKGLCGKVSCPILEKQKAYIKIKDTILNLKKDIQSMSPAPFIGRIGYPYINVGILAPPEISDDIDYLDAPRQWAEKKEDIPSIIEKRSILINSRKKTGILEKNRFINIAQEIAMAKTSPEISLKLKEIPTFSVNLDAYNLPTGPKAEVESARVEENPKINIHIEKATSDTDLLSNDALKILYKKGIDENQLSKLLSVGTLGIGNRRKLVPTRWSITAVDDSLGKEIIDEIKEYPETDYITFFGGYLGNYYLIMLFPEIWSFELFEIYLPKTSWNQENKIEFCKDHELFQGRKSYAENCAGGYYAARLPILEYLKKVKRQSTIIALRFITSEYTTPLGVWVCREACRDSTSNKPIEFSSKELQLNYAKIITKKKFGIDLDLILKESILLKNIDKQIKLTNFL
jgi:DNA repair protein NreA